MYYLTSLPTLVFINKAYDCHYILVCSFLIVETDTTLQDPYNRFCSPTPLNSRPCGCGGWIFTYALDFLRIKR